MFTPRIIYHHAIQIIKSFHVLHFFKSIIVCTGDGCLESFNTLVFFSPHIHFHSIVSAKKYRLSCNRPRSTITDIEAHDTSLRFTTAQQGSPRSTFLTHILRVSSAVSHHNVGIRNAFPLYSSAVNITGR